MVRSRPFTIRLKCDVPGKTQPLVLGLDPGRANIGLAVVNERGECVFAAEVRTGNHAVTRHVAERADHRHQRRYCARVRRRRRARRSGACFDARRVQFPKHVEGNVHLDCRGHEAKFANRRNAGGWPSPSARQLVAVHRLAVVRVKELLPVTSVVVEWTVLNFGNEEPRTREATCAMCGAPTEETHHVVPRRFGGANGGRNLIDLCAACHHALHVGRAPVPRWGEFRRGTVVLLSACTRQIVTEVGNVCPVDRVVAGAQTAGRLKVLGLPKSHAADAVAIATWGLSEFAEGTRVAMPKQVHELCRYTRSSAKRIHKLGRRVYSLDGAQVAVGRHRATAQPEPSLEDVVDEWHSQGVGEHEVRRRIRRLMVEPAHRVYRDCFGERWARSGDLVVVHDELACMGKVIHYVDIALMTSDRGVVLHGGRWASRANCRVVARRSLEFTQDAPRDNAARAGRVATWFVSVAGLKVSRQAEDECIRIEHRTRGELEAGARLLRRVGVDGVDTATLRKALQLAVRVVRYTELTMCTDTGDLFFTEDDGAAWADCPQGKLNVAKHTGSATVGLHWASVPRRALSAEQVQRIHPPRGLLELLGRPPEKAAAGVAKPRRPCRPVAWLVDGRRLPGNAVVGQEFVKTDGGRWLVEIWADRTVYVATGDDLGHVWSAFTCTSMHSRGVDYEVVAVSRDVHGRAEARALTMSRRAELETAGYTIICPPKQSTAATRARNARMAWICVDTGEVFASVRQAADAHGLTDRQVFGAVRYHTGRAGGLTWREVPVDGLDAAGQAEWEAALTRLAGCEQG